MKITPLTFTAVVLVPVMLAARAAQAPREPAGGDPASLVKPLAESWPT